MVKTDAVVVGGAFRATADLPEVEDFDLAIYRPAIGGSAITPDGRDPAGVKAYGTLGCVVVNTDPGDG
jgi:hypothetical protein